MTENDREYVKKVLESGLIKSPCLELGAGYEGKINRTLIQNSGITYYSTDIQAGERVDFVVDFELDRDLVMKTFQGIEKFETILVLNVLEHTFNPLKVLDNIFAILKPGGTCIIITPAVLVLHKYPIDCWRINPDFYEEYCKRRELKLLYEYFEYMGREKVRDNMIGNDYYYPSPSPNKFKTLWSRIIHKLFNTYGRSMFFPWHVTIGVVIKNEKP